MSATEAYRMAESILGYPCPCDQCSEDGGAAKSQEILDLAADLCGESQEAVLSEIIISGILS